MQEDCKVQYYGVGPHVTIILNLRLLEGGPGSNSKGLVFQRHIQREDKATKTTTVVLHPS